MNSYLISFVQFKRLLRRFGRNELGLSQLFNSSICAGILGRAHLELVDAGSTYANFICTQFRHVIDFSFSFSLLRSLVFHLDMFCAPIVARFHTRGQKPVPAIDDLTMFLGRRKLLDI